MVLTAMLVVIFGYSVNYWACDFGKALQSGVGCSPTIGVICMAFSMVITLVVSLFTKAPDKAIVDGAFEDKKEEEAKPLVENNEAVENA